MKKLKLIIINVFLVILICYATFTVINQQKTLNQYSKNKQELEAQIKEENEYKEQLTANKDNVNSLEFIEKNAREYLDMYLPNEKVYIDQGK